MRLYLDDDIASAALARLLRTAAHDVVLPIDVGMAGEDDPVHLTFAIRENRATLTRNYSDFRNLHNLIMQAQGHHPGILVVRRDNDPKRNLSVHDILRALGKLLAAGVPVVDEYHILNQWQ